MKQQLVKQIPAVIALLLLVAGCSKDAVTDAVPDATDRISLTIQVSTEGFSSTDSHSTRAADVGYTTVFQQGDRLGIVAVLHDGSKQNLCATYNADTQTWEGEAVYYDPQTTYLSAYFPYTAALTDRLGSISDADGVVSALKTLMPPLADQSSLDAYRASDLLTGTCTLNTTGGSKSLNISLAHAYSLLVLQAGTEYTTDGGFTYRAPLQSVQVIVDDVLYYTPLASAEDHRLIVDKSGSSPSVEWFYTLLSGTTYKTSDSGSLAEGAYHLYTNITSTETRNLAVGDFYYSDGSIAPKDAPNPPSEGCIGVIYCVDNNFIANNSTKKTNGGYTHALVVALRDASTSSDWYVAPATASGYETKVAAPDNSSGWYLPNLDELKYICWGNSTSQSTDGKTALNTQFAKLAMGNEFVFGNAYYWSSTEDSLRYAYAVYFGYGYTDWKHKSGFCRVRSSLAF